MASYTKEITLDLNANMAYTTIVAKQGDSARWLKVHLTKDNIAYPIDATHNFMYRMRKPDGKGIINPAVVQLGHTLTYLKIIVTEENFNNRDYYIQLNGEYNLVSIDSFFSIVLEPEEDKTQYYVKIDDNYRKATNNDVAPFFNFSVDSSTQYYYLQDNINAEESTINVQLTEQVLAVPGRGYADIVEYDENGDVLSTISFIVNVMASPDVAKNATSSDEFQELVRVVAEADEIISEAEAWARGSKNSIPQNIKYTNIGSISQEEFNNQKQFLYIKVEDNYVRLTENDTYDPTETYYTASAGTTNNAEYFSNQARSAFQDFTQLSVTSTTLPTGASASVEKVVDQDEKIIGLNFGLPAGPTGAAGLDGAIGPSGVYVGEDEPASPTEYQVWINPNVDLEPVIITANQVYYSAEVAYTSNTIGNAVIQVEDKIKDAIAAASEARQAADDAEAAAAQVSSVQADVSGIQNILPTKITDPADLPDNDTYILTKKNPADPSASPFNWSKSFDYNKLINPPKINGVSITGNKTLLELGIAPAAMGGASYYIKPTSNIPKTDLEATVQATLSKADESINTIILNNDSYSTSDGIVNLGTWLTNRNIINKNYLDNPHFTINQHGFKEISSETGVYFCDRWKVLEDTGTGRTITTVSPETSGSSGLLTISTGEDVNITIIQIGQIISDEVWSILSGKQITISISYKLNDYETFQIKSWTMNCPLYHSTSGSGAIRLDDTYYWGAKLAGREINDKICLVLSIFWNATDFEVVADSAIEINKVKLELGNYSTLQQEAPPVYSEELKKCQQYFVYYGGKPSQTSTPVVLGFGIATASGANGLLEWTVPNPIQMVGNPSIVSSVNLEVRRGIVSTRGSVGTITTERIAESTAYNGAANLYLQTAAASLTVDAPYFVILPATASASEGSTETISSISFSAEP